MSEEKWAVVYEVPGQFQADIIRSLLEAQGIPVFVSGEAVGRVLSFTVGPTAEVQILVPIEDLPRARQILEEVDTENLTDQETPEDQEETPD